MKKILLLFTLSLLVFTSCETDETDETQQEENIIGTFKYSMTLLDGEEQEVPFICDLEDNFVFSTDNTVIETYYDQDNNGDCVIDESYPGTWVKSENNFYSLTFNGETDVFILQGDQLSYILNYNNGTPDDTSDDFITTDVYLRQ